MLDDRLRMMLEVANTLTAEDLEFLRKHSPDNVADLDVGAWQGGAHMPTSAGGAMGASSNPSIMDAPSSDSLLFGRGEYERQRPRDSKVATSCLGEERVKHDWWPLGTELVGQIGSETFHARVVENRSVKSGRSLLIVTGPAQGRVCITPTRAAIEATEAHRQAHNLGRSGGITNGWLFWQPRAANN